jgi:hypothetical protein
MSIRVLYVCAALLVATPAQAGAGRFYCEGNVGPITVDLGDKQNTVWFDDKVKDRKVGAFPTRQRYIQIREPAIWVDTKELKVTLDGKPCDMRGYDH